MILFLWVGLKESQPMILILMDICVYISYYSFTGIIPKTFLGLVNSKNTQP